jgi:hypothetical protein
MKKYSNETILALSLIGAGVGYMLSDKYNKYGKLGTFGFMVGGMALGFGVANLLTKNITPKAVETILPPISETPEINEAVGSAE